MTKIYRCTHVHTFLFGLIREGSVFIPSSSILASRFSEAWRLASFLEDPTPTMGSKECCHILVCSIWLVIVPFKCKLSHLTILVRIVLCCRSGGKIIFRVCINRKNQKHKIHVAVPCRNRGLFHRIFRSHRCLRSAVLLNFR